MSTYDHLFVYKSRGHFFKISILFILLLVFGHSVYLYLYENYIFLSDSPSTQQIIIINSTQFNSIQEFNLFNRTNDPRVVFFTTATGRVGYGNKIYAFLTSFTIALLTDSALIMRWPSINNYIQEPFTMAYGPFPDNNPLNPTFNWESVCILNTHTVNSWKRTKKLLANDRSIDIPANYTRYLVTDVSAYFFDLFQIREHADKLVQKGYIQAKTVDKAYKLFEDETIIENQKVESLYMIGFEFAGSVLNSHWKLTTYMDKKLNLFWEKYFKDSYVIGK